MDINNMDKTETFLEYRNLLFSVAYDMLGSVEDAEDIVNEVYLKWRSIDISEINQPKAYLVKIVTNNSINLLKRAKKKRVEYSGLWLPEPLENHYSSSPASSVEIYYALSVGLLMVLEKLTAHERAVFLLREVFSYDYSEISDIINKSEENCRQIFKRAKQHLHGEEKRYAIDMQAHENMLNQFVDACTSGNIEQLISLLKDDIAIHGDTGGYIIEAKGEKIKATSHPPKGKVNIAKFLIGIAKKFARMFPESTNEVKILNGSPAIIFYNNNAPMAILILEMSGNLIGNIYSYGNPEKLKKFVKNYRKIIKS